MVEMSKKIFFLIKLAQYLLFFFMETNCYANFCKHSMTFKGCSLDVQFSNTEAFLTVVIITAIFKQNKLLSDWTLIGEQMKCNSSLTKSMLI